MALSIIPVSTINRFVQKQNSTRFYDRNGILLQVLPLEEGLRREYYSLDSIPLQLQQSFIQAEDKNFYHHWGVDFISIIRAARQNKKAGRVVSGASTITMQLARLVYPRKKNAPVTLRVKFSEMMHAFILETKFSKKKILELYLNTIPFGYQIEGVGSAARSFYGVEPMGLSVEQMQSLAQIPRRPSEYAPPKTFTYPNLCPHFVQYVIGQYHSRAKTIPNALTLSVDSHLTMLVENEIQQKITDYKEARIHNGSAFVINNRTGEIVVWVGNGSFTDSHGGQIDGVLVRNQPGSSMKPFLYALALEDGVAPATVIPDIPQDFGSSKVYVPLNFNNRYNGPVRMRVALASSLNIPAVYLLYNIGVTEYMQKLSQLGFASLDGERGSTGLSIALGSSEVTLYEMVRAFSVFPREGVLPEITFFSKGKFPTASASLPMPVPKRNAPRAYSADTARVICDFLSDKSARSLGFGHAKVFDTPYPCIFKTGTSNQFQNIIALGATSEFTAGVWLGNFEGETVIRQTGSSIPAAIVRNILDSLTARYGALPFNEPKTYIKQDICVLSGMAPSKDCPAVAKEFVKIENINSPASDGKQNRTLCTWHYSENGRTQIRYPSEYQHWASNKNMSGTFVQTGTALDFLYPTNGAVFVYDPSVPQNVQLLRIQVVGGTSPDAELYLDDVSFGKMRDRFSWNVPLTRGTHELTVNCGQETKTIGYSVE